jgi:hypothetical protein
MSDTGESNPEYSPAVFPKVEVILPGDTDNGKILDAASIDYEFFICKARTPDNNGYYRWLSKGEWRLL